MHEMDEPRPLTTSESSTQFSSSGDASSEDAPKIRIGSILAERYRLDARLGHGGMGEVFKAYDLDLDEAVALKLFPVVDEAEQRAIFLNEVKLARQITHPNVCRVHDLGSAGGRDFLTMELIDGEDFATILRRDGRAEFERALEIATELCEGLHAVHEQGILHRDLKPSNVMLDHRRKPRITDFGLASRHESKLAAGTMAYMAPELFQGEPATIATEIYALGLLIYEVFTGRRVFRQKSMVSLAHAHKNLQPKSMREYAPEIPEEIDRVVLGCLNKWPKDRPRSVERVCRVLEDHLQRRPVKPAARPRPCATCAFENPAEMSFCGRCGSPLLRRCPNCDTENPPGFAFCGNCAEPLLKEDVLKPPAAASPETAGRRFDDDSTELAPTEKREDPPTTDALDSAWTPRRPRAERRRLTVLALMLGSADEMESQREAVRQMRRFAEKEIRDLDGTPVHLLSRKVVAYFGFPRAHEDSAARAVAVAWRLRDRLAESFPAVYVRAGVHSAVEVIDIDELGRVTLVGDTPETTETICARLAPGQIAVSSACRRLVEPYYDLASSRDEESLDEGDSAYIVLRETAGRRPDSTKRRLVGREEELALVRRAWRRARNGQGQAIWISGQPGIGKTHFVREVAAAVDTSGGLVFEHRANPHRSAEPLHPIIGEWRRRLDLRSLSDDEQFARLRRALPDLSGEEMSLVASALHVAHDLPAPQLSPRRRRQLLFASLSDAWIRPDQPALLVFEDLQWADPTTLDLIGSLTERTPMEPILVLCTARSGIQPPWRRPALQTLHLGRLDEENGRRLLQNEHDLPEAIVSEISRRADGVPLYLEELARALLEQGKRPDELSSEDLQEIPDSLQDLLAARLDRLGDAREPAQIGAALGRGFDWSILRAVTREQFEEDDLEENLERLVEEGILFQRGTPPEARYRFRHALLQDAAYLSLLRSDRLALHRRILDTLTQTSPDMEKQQPSLLAHHAEGAGLSEQALPYRLNAGRRALRQSHHREAVHELERALQLLQDFPPSVARDLQELDLRLYLGSALMPLYGWAAGEVDVAFARARQIAEGLTSAEAPDEMFRLRRAIWIYDLARGALRDALESARLLLQDARRDAEQGELLEAHRALGATFFYLGDFQQALDHLNKTLDLYQTESHSALAYVYGIEPGAAAHALLADTLLFLGRSDEAQRHLIRAIEKTEKINHPFTRAMVYNHASMIYLFLGDKKSAGEWAEATLTVGREEGFPLWVAWGQALRGSAATRPEDGLNDLRQAVPKIRETGALLGVPAFYCFLAEACFECGSMEEALSSLNEAHAIMQITGERFMASRVEKLEEKLLFGPLS